MVKLLTQEISDSNTIKTKLDQLLSSYFSIHSTANPDLEHEAFFKHKPSSAVSSFFSAQQLIYLKFQGPNYSECEISIYSNDTLSTLTIFDSQYRTFKQLQSKQDIPSNSISLNQYQLQQFFKLLFQSHQSQLPLNSTLLLCHDANILLSQLSKLSIPPPNGIPIIDIGLLYNITTTAVHNQLQLKILPNTRTLEKLIGVQRYLSVFAFCCYWRLIKLSESNIHLIWKRCLGLIEKFVREQYGTVITERYFRSLFETEGEVGTDGLHLKKDHRSFALERALDLQRYLSVFAFCCYWRLIKLSESNIHLIWKRCLGLIEKFVREQYGTVITERYFRSLFETEGEVGTDGLHLKKDHRSFALERALDLKNLTNYDIDSFLEEHCSLDLSLPSSSEPHIRRLIDLSNSLSSQLQQPSPDLMRPFQIVSIDIGNGSGVKASGISDVGLTIWRYNPSTSQPCYQVSSLQIHILGQTQSVKAQSFHRRAYPSLQTTPIYITEKVLVSFLKGLLRNGDTDIVAGHSIVNDLQSLRDVGVEISNNVDIFDTAVTHKFIAEGQGQRQVKDLSQLISIEKLRVIMGLEDVCSVKSLHVSVVDSFLTLVILLRQSQLMRTSTGLEGKLIRCNGMILKDSGYASTFIESYLANKELRKSNFSRFIS
ncbi:hypothetical protein WICPIJ_008698 [Wickerhamomyces pijperi]|uniref:Uncharacterized protein n=1 Tax=Wickerhamomyces pijperi TaxID=599730 RepID=A0A9P8PVI6_WICPI|nr:hypothetical protein WICPIJ_008698 [Wickerhamomyces pijperi]